MAGAAIHVIGGISARGFGDRVSLKTEIQERLPQGRAAEEMTRNTAFKILDDIKFQNQAKAFLFKPIIAIPLSIGATILGFALLESASIIACIVGIVLAVGGIIACVVSVAASLEGRLPRLSKLYKSVADEADVLMMNMLEEPHSQTQFDFGERV